MLFERVVRPLLFRLEPERSHNVARWGLRREQPWHWFSRSLSVENERLISRLGPSTLPNPVGLAAGFDKNGDMVDSLQCLGFGFVTIGSILPMPRPGNEQPRLLRLPQERALMNCLGLPSQGVQHAAERLRKRRLNRVPVFANIAGFTIDEYLRCFAEIEPFVDGIELSLKCPNLDDMALDFLEPDNFEQLIARLMARRSKPILVKLPFYEDKFERDRRLELAARAMRYGVEGFSVAGTFSRQEPKLSTGRGSVSGTPARARTLSFVSDLWAVTEGKALIKASGGLSSGADVYAAISSGATLVGLLTGFVYQGWAVARTINLELLRLMDRTGITGVKELRGSGIALTAHDIDT